MEICLTKGVKITMESKENNLSIVIDEWRTEIRTEAIKEFAENNVCNMFNNLIKSAETNEQQQIVFLCKQRFVEMYMGVIKNLTHQPTKIVHNSLCETETYESR